MARKCEVVEKENLFEYIERNLMPKFLNGTATNKFNVPPKGVSKSALDLCGQHNITREEMQEYIDKYKPAMEEADKIA